jgi:hypothetical protein
MVVKVTRITCNGKISSMRVAKKNIEREPVNAVFLLDESISVPAARRIIGACLQAATSLYRYSYSNSLRIL